MVTIKSTNYTKIARNGLILQPYINKLNIND